MNENLLCNGRFRSLTAIGTMPMPWTHIAPRGEFPGTVEIPAGYDVPGHGVVAEDMEVDGLTVFNDQTLESMVQRFCSEILIDADHLSHEREQSTEALGWGHGLRYAPGRDGLEMETAWTPPGRDKISNQIYRYISPEFAGAVRFEEGVFKFYPSALTGAGLTNRPKLKALRPVSANHDTTTNHAAPEDNEAKGVELDAFVAMVKNRERCDSQTALIIAEAEKPELFYQENQATAPDEERANDIQIRGLIAKVKNREGCDFQTALIIARGEKPQLFYQEDRETAPGEQEIKEIQIKALVAKVKNRERCDFETAWNIAKAEVPELF